MVTKQDIENAIKARIDRFNRLYKKALGYTFEEEVEIEKKRYKAQMEEWNTVLEPRLIARANELGYEDDDEYFQYCLDNHIQPEDRDQEIQDLWGKIPVRPNPLYTYEMSVINQAKSIAFWFIDNFTGHEAEQWAEFAYDADHNGRSSWDFVKAIKEAGYDGWDDGHSGNSGSMAISFAFTLLHDTELFPYMHGALCYLVGDEGYHDDRSDVHEAVETYKTKKGQEE